MIKEIVGAIVAPVISVSRVIDSAAEGTETLAKSYDMEKRVEVFSKVQNTLAEKDRQEPSCIEARVGQLKSLW